MSDIQSLQGAPYFFPRIFEEENVSAGMMARHIIISDRHGAFSKFNVDLPDMVFMISVLAQMLRDDAKAFQSFRDYKILGTSKTADALKSQLKTIREAVEEASGVLENLEVFTPKDFRKDEAAEE